MEEYSDLETNAVVWNGFLIIVIPLLVLFAKFSPTFSTKTCQMFFMPTKKEADLLQEALGVKQEMSKISMVDEFAKYAKLQRRLNQLKLSLESDIKARNSVHSSISRWVTFALYGLIGIVYLIILFNYGKAHPVLILPTRWYFPLNYIFSVPTGVPGAISIPVWSIMCKTLINLL